MKTDVKIDVVQFLEGLGIKNVRVVGDEANFSCPSPDHRHGDSTPSASMNIHSTAWNCFGCGRRGNAVTFLAEMEGVNTMIAMRWIRETFGVGTRGSLRGSLARDFKERWADQPEQPEEFVNPPLDESWLEHFSVDWGVAALYLDELPEGITYPFSRGFLASTLEHFQCGWEEREGRFIFPLYNTLGCLVGFKGRASNSYTEPRYRVFGRPYYPFATCKVAEIVFNADRVEQDHGHVIVVEGELNCMKLWQLGHRNAVAIAGAQMSRRQAAIINALATSVTLYFDSDPAGNAGTRHAASLLHEHLPLALVPPHERDPADSLAEEVQNLLDQSQSITHSYLGYNDYLTTIIEKN